MQSINIIVSGVKNGDNVEYRCIKNGVLQYIPIVNGINKLPASELTENPDFNIGFVLNINSTGIINLKQIPTSIIAGTAANEQYLERKQCADHVQFVNDMWRTSYAQQNQRFEDRQTINQEMFGIYSAMRNGFDVINAAANKNAFDLYKYSRDNKDELMGQIGEMKTELAVLKATRPYQDALIQRDIRRVAEHADFNLWRRTCRMISGEVVLPNTPTVTGYASYNPCACPATTPAPTTAA